MLIGGGPRFSAQLTLAAVESDLRGKPPERRRFSEPERRFLIAEPRIGAQVVDRLEQVGIHSIGHLRQMGAAAAVLAVCDRLGTIAWANRRQALEQALSRSARFV